MLPTFDVREQHRIQVAASVAVTYAAIGATDLAGSRIARGLLTLRALPSAILGGPACLRALRQRGHVAVTLREFEAQGFRIIAEDPPRELAIGLEGRFWTPNGELRTPEPERFRDTAPAPGSARAVWNFSLRPLDRGRCELATETRVLCADAATRQRFLPYWYIIRYASGIIRIMMLREIRRTAERTTSVPRTG